jgi:hypothetical protein
MFGAASSARRSWQGCHPLSPEPLQMKDTETDMTRPHQPGQAVFKSILPEDIDWQPFPAFPPAVRLAVIRWPSLRDRPLRHQSQGARRHKTYAA